MLFDWLHHRTGYRDVLESMLLEHVPGGARWRYVWGSTLVFVFSLQLVTGLLLMMSYSPSDANAWSSVHFIQYRMDFGWLIRGLHHFGSQTMMVLIALHMLQVVLAGAHLPPREFNWWLGMGLFAVTFGLSLTGYLLPWDQKGYWATRVATNIASNMPGGDFIKQTVVGGQDYGNHTLTRFYGLHVGVLPLTLIVLLVFHIALFRRHGVTAPASAQGVEHFWPGQVFRDLIACLVVFAVMVWLICGMPPFGEPHGNVVVDQSAPEGQTLYDYWAHAGQRGLGANLDAPADRDTAGYPARPEWYFLFLFQLLKYFEGPHIFVGTVLIPNGVFLLLLLLPLFGFGRMRVFGYWFGVMVMIVLILGALTLTALAFASDSPEWAPQVVRWMGVYDEKDAKNEGVDKARAKAQEKAREEAQKFQDESEKARVLAQRAAQLAMAGVPDRGSRVLLRQDPLIAGRELFKIDCASCHRYTATDKDESITTGKKASDLGGWGGEAWVRGLLDNPGDERYFGLTSLEGMKEWKQGVLERWETQLKEDKAEGEKVIAKDKQAFDTVARWLPNELLPPEKRDRKLEEEGRAQFKAYCARCHRYGDDGPKKAGRAPELTGYGSPEWLRLMIMSPACKARYPKDNEMPAFRAVEGPGTEVSLREFYDSNPDFPRDKVLPLSDVERELIIRFVLGDARVVFGGDTISGVPR